MQKLNTLTILTLVSAIACIPVEKETGETDTGTDEPTPDEDCTNGTDDDGDGDADCDDSDCADATECAVETSVAWTSTDIALTITNGDAAATYNWGIAENAGDCVDNGWCWTGEDCHLGYTVGTTGQTHTAGDVLQYCHPASVTGVTIAYGAQNQIAEEGQTTVFSNDSFSPNVTYILDNAASTEAETCWVWGIDPTYYSGYTKTCTEM